MTATVSPSFEKVRFPSSLAKGWRGVYQTPEGLGFDLVKSINRQGCFVFQVGNADRTAPLENGLQLRKNMLGAPATSQRGLGGQRFPPEAGPDQSFHIRIGRDQVRG